MTLQAALDALTSDAKKWDGTSTVLGNATATVTNLNLYVSDFSWIAPLVGLQDSYAKTRQHIEDVLRAGTTETHNIAENLRHVRTIFEGTDEAAKAKLDGTWDWVE